MKRFIAMLLTALLAVSCAQAGTMNSLPITVEGFGLSAEFMIDDLRALAGEEITLIRPTDDGEDTVQARGVSLTATLSALGLDWSKVPYITVSGSPEEAQAVLPAPLLTGMELYLLTEINGETLDKAMLAADGLHASMWKKDVASITLYETPIGLDGGFAVIALPENPSTGYAWSWKAEGDGAMRLCGSVYAPVGEVMPGAGGVRTFVFSPEDVGTVTLSFALSQPWDGAAAPVETAAFEYFINEAITAVLTAADRPTETLTLSENMTTGYCWTYTMSDANIVSELSSEYRLDSDKDGAPGEHTWIFQGVTEGDVTLTFAYARPWETDAPDEPLRVTLRVDAEGNVTRLGAEGGNLDMLIK